MSRTLVELDAMQESRVPPAIILTMHPTSPLPFLPTSEIVYEASSPFFSSSLMINNDSKELNNLTSNSTDELIEDSNDSRQAIINGRFLPSNDLGHTTLDNLLAIVPFDLR